LVLAKWMPPCSFQPNGPNHRLAQCLLTPTNTRKRKHSTTFTIEYVSGKVLCRVEAHTIKTLFEEVKKHVHQPVWKISLFCDHDFVQKINKFDVEGGLDSFPSTLVYVCSNMIYEKYEVEKLILYGKCTPTSHHIDKHYVHTPKHGPPLPYPILTFDPSSAPKMKWSYHLRKYEYIPRYADVLWEVYADCPFCILIGGYITFRSTYYGPNTYKCEFPDGFYVRTCTICSISLRFEGDTMEATFVGSWTNDVIDTSWYMKWKKYHLLRAKDYLMGHVYAETPDNPY
jgi:hypothetical protein